MRCSDPTPAEADMTQTVADLPAFLRDASPSVKDATLAALLAERMVTAPGKSLDVPGVGFVVPLGSPGGTPPVLSPDQEAEFARRLAARHQARPLSAFLRKLYRGG
jgi:hypothetical protein